MVKTAQDFKSPLKLIEHVVESNKKRKKVMFKKILRALPKNNKSKTVSVLGLTFKPNTDDMRDSPSLEIIPSLINKKCNVKVYDPEGMKEAKKYLSSYKNKISWCKDPYDASKKSDALVILTEWNQFRALDLLKLKKLLRTKIIIDLRNIYNPEEIKNEGFEYHSIGRGDL